MRRLTLLLIALIPVATHAQLKLTSDFGTLTISDAGGLQSLATREEPPYELLRHTLDLCVLQEQIGPQSGRVVDDRALLDFGPEHGRLTIQATAQPWGFVLEIVEACATPSSSARRSRPRPSSSRRSASAALRSECCAWCPDRRRRT